jgi:hypothetical protein
MSDQEEYERILAETIRQMRQQDPTENGEMNPIEEQIISQLKQMLDPATRRQAMTMHSAGATVVPTHPFGELPIPRNSVELGGPFWEKWVIPYYMSIPFSVEESCKTKMLEIKPDIDAAVVNALLGDFNWRTRHVGAYFAAITRQYDVFPSIGNMLLQSEVALAGKTYAIVLASYKADFAIHYYLEYLRYYLRHPEYDFDQDVVGAGLFLLAEKSGTHSAELQEIEQLWGTFVKLRGYGQTENIREDIGRFEEALANLVDIRDS